MKKISSKGLLGNSHALATSNSNKRCQLKILVLSSVAALSITLVGCSNQPFSVHEQLEDYNFGTIAIMPGPELTPEEPTMPPVGPVEKGESVRAGARDVASSSFREAASRCGGIGLACLLVSVEPFECIAFTGACTLIVGTGVALVLAPIGAIVGAATYDPEKTLKIYEAHNAIVRFLEELEPSEMAATFTFNMAQANTTYSLQQATRSSDPILLAKSGVVTVLEITVTDLHFLSTRRGVKFIVKAHSRLIRAKNSKVIDEFDTFFESEIRSYSEWGANDAQLLRGSLTSAFHGIADSIVGKLM